MSANRFHIFLVSLFALVLAGVFFFGPTALAAEEKDGGTYTGIPKDRSCTWWLDESKEVSKDDKDAIKKLFEALETKLEKDGLDSVEFPWKPPKEEEKKAEEETKKEKELTDEQKKWEKDEWFEDPEVCPGVIIPSKDDLNIAKVDGVPMGTLFVVRGTLDDPRIEVWRLKLNKEGDDWLVTGREIEYSFNLLHIMHFKKKSAYKFSGININQDLLHIELTEGRFYPLYAGTKIVGGSAFGKGKLSFKPPRKLAKDLETDVDTKAFVRATKAITDKKGVDEFKDVAVTKITFFFSPSNVDKFVEFKGLEKIEVTDTSEFKEAEKMAKGEIDWLAKTNFGAKLPYKGQAKEGEKHDLMLYQLPVYDELCDIYLYTPEYKWFGYKSYPTQPGDQQELYVYANRDKLFTVGDERKSEMLARYNRADQRERFTRREAEYEPTEEATTLDRRVDINVGYKEQSVDLPAEIMGGAEFFNAQTAIFAKMRATIELEMTKSGVAFVPIGLSSLPSKPAIPMEVKWVVDDRGLDILRLGTFDLVFPSLALGQRVKVTAEYEGPVCARLFTSSSYTSGNTDWYPSYGFIQCSPIQIVLGVPKPYLSASVGGLADRWTGEDRNFSRWESDQCFRMAGFLFSDYSLQELDVPKPDGGVLHAMFFYHPKLRFYITPQDWVDFDRAQEDMEGSKRKEEQKRDRSRIDMREVATRAPDSVLDDFESILKFQQALYVSLPYEKIAAVQLPVWSGYGQGFPSMLTLDGTSFLSAGDRALYEIGGSRWGAEFWAHEAGHQYWGHVIGWGNRRDQWFSEAFTEHQCAMYMQASRGDAEYQSKLKDWRGGFLYIEKIDEETPLTRPEFFSSEWAWYGTFYCKGPYVVHMMRQMLGDQAFMAYTRNLVKSLFWKRAKTSDFIDVLEQTLGKENMLALFGKDNMQWFFDQWIYGTGVPSYEYGYEISGNTAKVKIKHTGAQFRTRIPIWVYPESGDKYAIPVLLTGEKPIEEFDLTLRGPAKKLVLDEFGSVLTKNIKEVKYKKIE